VFCVKENTLDFIALGTDLILLDSWRSDRQTPGICGGSL
jgi:hypothetical protein